MAIPQEKFTSIKSEVIDLVSILFDSFNPDLDVDAQLEAHNSALGDYVNRVARIGMASSVLGYKGLRDICVTFQDHLRQLHEQNRVLTAEERELLEEWPMLVMGYLSDASNDATCDDLIAHLQRIIPEGKISQSDYAEMQQLLQYDGQQLDETETNLVIDDTPVPMTQANTGSSLSTEHTEISGASPIDSIAVDYEEANPEADEETLTAIVEEIGDAVTELVTTIEEIKQDNQSRSELSAALDLCADRLEIVGISIANTGLMGLMDVVMYSQEGLRNLAQQPDPEQLHSITLMTDWANALLDYLSDTTNPDNSINLVAATRQLPWIDAFDDSEAETLLTLLMPEHINLDSLADTDNPGMDESKQDDTSEYLIRESQPDYNSPVMEFIQSGSDNKKEAVSAIDGFNTKSPAEQCQNIEPSGIVQTGLTEEHQELQLAELDKPPVILSDAIQELISLLHTEINSVQSRLNSILTEAIETEQPEDMQQSLAEYLEEVERFALAADSLGLQGLSNVFGNLGVNLQQLIESSEFTTERGMLLAEWPGHILSYLSDVNDQAVVQSLLHYLGNPEWPLPVNQEVGDELQEQLLSPVIELEEEESEPRQQQATAEAVSLQLPGDVNQELLNSLLRELPGYTAEFTAVVNRLTEGAATQQDVDVAQRIAHTLKGAANTVGVSGIASLTHHIEDILQAFSKHGVLPGTGLAETLMQAADALEAMSESLLGMGPSPDDAVSVLQQVLDWANHIDEHGIPEHDMQIAQTHAPQAANQDPDETSSLSTEHEQEEQLSGETILRVPATLIDDLLRVVGESVILNGQLFERLHMALQQTRAAQEHNKLLQQLTFDLEQLVDIQGLTWTQQRLQINEEFDALEMDQYNELHTVTRRLVEAATDSQEFAHSIEEQLGHLDEHIIEQGRLHKINQEIVMQTRMVPVQNIVPRLQRAVRQTSRLTDKKVSLDVKGSNTLMDSDVLNNLIDPLMHILRNAIDHGIEPEAIRLAKGKQIQGRVTLTFLREGDQMVVRCQDDGAGLDYDAIRNTALERGLIEAEHAVSDEELRHFILQQGFSTRTQATQISGRGIGMDAVYNRIISLKGTLSISSEPGAGMLMELRMPITFISIHGLLIRSRERKIVLSSRGVEQILYPGAGVLHADQDILTYKLGDETYEAVHIEQLLHLKSDRRKTMRQDCPVMLVRQDTGSLRAILVEEVMASQDLVVKSLGKYMPVIDGIEGATILGDGSVATVIDLPDLLRADTRRLQIERGEFDEDLILETPLPCALVVDDSLTARRTLAEFIQDMGYEVRTARDGLEAIDVIESKQPDIVLVDLEMPRMNGLELTNHIRAKQETREIPIIMVTSRSTEKHRHQAEAAGVNLYLTKPFSEDDLMQHIERLQIITA